MCYEANPKNLLAVTNTFWNAIVPPTSARWRALP